MSKARKSAPGVVKKPHVNDEWEIVEEQLVHVELSGGIFQDDLSRSSDQGSAPFSKFVGLDTAEPFVQLGNQIFVGKYVDSVGTSLFFADDDAPRPVEENDPVFNAKAPVTKLKFECKTDKKLVLQRVFLQEKDAAVANASS